MADKLSPTPRNYVGLGFLERREDKELQLIRDLDNEVNSEDHAKTIKIPLLGTVACGVEQFQIMYISDIGDFYAGLFLRGSKKWRKQTYALKNMMEILPDPAILKKLSEGTEGIYAYVFKGAGDKEVIMAWNTNKEEVEKEFEVKGTELTLSTRDGEKKAIKAAGGKVKVMLGQSPVYVY